MIEEMKSDMRKDLQKAVIAFNEKVLRQTNEVMKRRKFVGSLPSLNGNRFLKRQKASYPKWNDTFEKLRGELKFATP